MLAIYRREVHSYFTSPIGYLLIAFLLLMNGFYFTAYNLQNGYSNYGLVLYPLYGGICARKTQIPAS